MTRKTTKGSVFNAIEEDAGVAEQLKIKAALMDCIRNYIEEEGITQQEAADRMGVQRSRTVSYTHLTLPTTPYV